MKKFLGLFFLLIILGVAGYYWWQQTVKFFAFEPASSGETVDLTLKKEKEKLDAVIPALDSPVLPAWRENLGQLFMLGFSGREPSPEFLALIAEGKIGGVILLKQNLGTEKEIRALIEKMQALAPANKPLFIAVDQEGGPVSRLPESLVDTTPQRSITSASVAYTVGVRRGAALSNLGFNLVFSPVLDKVTSPDSFIYDRVFNGTEEDIITWGGAMIEGYREGGVISCPKHYPGFDDSAADAHEVLPTVTVAAELDDYAHQFKSIIEKNQPAMLMSTHVLIPALAEEVAVFSPRLIKEKLRDEWQYEGVVITDDLEMGAVGEVFSPAEAAVAALAAGNDLLLFIGTRAKYDAAFDAVETAVQSGALSTTEIERSITRVLALKKTLGAVSIDE